LVFAATTVNYLDRNVLGLLKKTLSGDGVFGALPGDQELNYSTVVICFQIAYALGMLLAGKIIDKVGTKEGYAYSLIGWSLAAIGHAFGHHTWSFGMWRAALGVTEAGNFPAANKAIAECSRKRNARWPPGSTIQARTWVPSSRRSVCRGSPATRAGNGRSSSPARSACCGSSSGIPFMTRRRTN
jgi:ACS family hexuronate transporter-like MFS transporter